MYKELINDQQINITDKQNILLPKISMLSTNIFLVFNFAVVCYQTLCNVFRLSIKQGAQAYLEIKNKIFVRHFGNSK